jgi:hypothetical protein
MRDGGALPLMVIGRHTCLAYFPAPRRVFIYAKFYARNVKTFFGEKVFRRPPT